MTTKLETLVLSTALITENGSDYHLEVRCVYRGKEDKPHKTEGQFHSLVMHGNQKLFTNHHNDFVVALHEFYERYAHPSATEKMHGP